MNNAAKLGAGVAGGYLLGRTKKLKLAIGLGAVLMGKRLRLSPTQLAFEGLGQLRESPEFAELTDRVRTELGGAGKRAFAAAATSRLDSLADRLSDRNQALEGGGEDEEYDEEEDDYGDDDAPRDEDEDYDGEEDEYDDEEDDYDDEQDDYDDEDEAGPEDVADDEAYPDESPGRQRTARNGNGRSSRSSGKARSSSARRR